MMPLRSRTLDLLRLLAVIDCISERGSCAIPRPLDVTGVTTLPGPEKILLVLELFSKIVGGAETVWRAVVALAVGHCEDARECGSFAGRHA